MRFVVVRSVGVCWEYFVGFSYSRLSVIFRVLCWACCFFVVVEDLVLIAAIYYAFLVPFCGLLLLWWPFFLSCSFASSCFCVCLLAVGLLLGLVGIPCACYGILSLCLLVVVFLCLWLRVLFSFVLFPQFVFS